MPDAPFDPILISFPQADLKELSKRLRHYHQKIDAFRHFSLRARGVVDDEQGDPLMKEEACQSEV